MRGGKHSVYLVHHLDQISKISLFCFLKKQYSYFPKLHITVSSVLSTPPCMYSTSIPSLQFFNYLILSYMFMSLHMISFQPDSFFFFFNLSFFFFPPFLEGTAQVSLPFWNLLWLIQIKVFSPLVLPSTYRIASLYNFYLHTCPFTLDKNLH